MITQQSIIIMMFSLLHNTKCLTNVCDIDCLLNSDIKIVDDIS